MYFNGAQNFVVHNSQIYNISSYGIYNLTSTGYIHDLDLYGNASYPLYIASKLTFYNTLKYFNNANVFNGTPTTGSSADIIASNL